MRRDRIANEITKLPVMQAVHRRIRNAKARRANKPLTGAYYWVPTPDKQGHPTWQLLEFYDKHYNGFAEHSQVWPEVLQYLALKWNKNPLGLQHQLSDAMYGLPRGRVVEMANRQYGIAHGEDAPIPKSEAMAAIKSTFNLRSTPTRAYKDEHEQMFPDHLKTVQHALKTPLAVKAPTWDELGAEDPTTWEEGHQLKRASTRRRAR